MSKRTPITTDIVIRLRSCAKTGWGFPDVENTAADEIESLRGDVQALVSTVSFLSSVIRSGEPFTPDVAQAVDNAFERIERRQADANQKGTG